MLVEENEQSADYTCNLSILATAQQNVVRIIPPPWNPGNRRPQGQQVYII